MANEILSDERLKTLEAIGAMADRPVESRAISDLLAHGRALSAALATLVEARAYDFQAFCPHDQATEMRWVSTEGMEDGRQQIRMECPACKALVVLRVRQK